jgi:Poly(ADP-ribose) polymerase catalytic domain/WGR domain
MAKLEKSVYPNNSSPNDFQCYGPPATEDGQFDKCKIADLGCFTQDGKDSNKYYHAAVVQHKNTKQWFVYFEWGRTGGNSPTFQFVECSSESEAQREFAKQLHEKNDKRGQWVTVAGLKTLQAKPNKDCYLVRPMATRSTGLPDAKTIKINEGAKVTAAPTVTSSKPKFKVDSQTLHLMKDLNVATVSYTRGVMADASLPTQKCIDDARQVIQETQKRLLKIGDNIDVQVADKELNELTRLMYSRIPKKKALHCEPKEWILNKDNILVWTADLDAFESALYATDVNDSVTEDVFAGMPITMEWVDAKSDLGKFLYNWWPKASGNRHGGVGAMRIKNLWKVQRHGDDTKIYKKQEAVLKEKPTIKERPLYQPSERKDLNDNDLMKKYADTNTSLLFHGTRSVNVPGILRENLRLPHQLVGVVITGAMFGPGLYWADDWKKSAGYTSLHGSYWSSGNGSVKGRDAFMFAGDVVLGNPYVAPSSGGYTSAPKGHHSVYGKAGKSGVQNNEFIIYEGSQYQLRYLIEFAA